VFTVLRIESELARSNAYISRINSLRPICQAHLDRRGCVVADLSRRRDDWDAHVTEVGLVLDQIRDVLVDARNSGDKTVVDVALYPRSHFAPGVMMAVDSHRFPTDVLRLLSDSQAILEITINSIAPDEPSS
jgi:hypothetical protein